jgi:hypothetical protein
MDAQHDQDTSKAAPRGLTNNHSRAVARGVQQNHSRAVAAVRDDA